jgi:citrate lyase subunit beta/citryl-CoA lyase
MLGFSGKLLIHPRQVAPAARGFLPSEAEIAWAERVVAASAGSGVTVVDGGMVDAPVHARATQVLRRAAKPTRY